MTTTRSIFENNNAISFTYKGIPCKVFKEFDGHACFCNMGCCMTNKYEITDEAIIFEGCKPHEFKDMADIKAIA